MRISGPDCGIWLIWITEPQTMRTCNYGKDRCGMNESWFISFDRENVLNSIVFFICANIMNTKQSKKKSIRDLFSFAARILRSVDCSLFTFSRFRGCRIVRSSCGWNQVHPVVSASPETCQERTVDSWTLMGTILFLYNLKCKSYANIIGNKLFIFTALKRSLGQGNIFTSVCHSFCLGGGVMHPGGGRGLGKPLNPSPHWILWDTVNKRALRILLECIRFVVGLGMLFGHVARIGAHVYFWKITLLTKRFAGVTLRDGSEDHYIHAHVREGIKPRAGFSGSSKQVNSG